MATTIEKMEEKLPRNGNGKAALPAMPNEIDELVARATQALAAFEGCSQEQVDAMVKAMALAGVSRRLELARMAVGARRHCEARCSECWI